ncbi:MAG: cation:proton antiporter [Clostridiales bacterium]|nr:cation:proton antiporter [Clostridiales bacterium]
MFDFIKNAMPEMSQAATVIISVALMLFGGFAMTRLTKLARLPNVTAYIIAGILLGPFCFKLVPQSIIDGMDFISDIALAFIAFGVGEFFRLETLKKSGVKVMVITVFEACMASALVFCVCYFVMKLDFAFSTVLAALAAATAPASTMMTIRQTGAKGEFVDTLLQVIAFDDVVGLVAYSIAISIALASTAGSGFDASVIWLPIVKNIIALALGALFGLLMKLLMPKKRSTDNRLIISVGILFTFCGICALLDVSPLLGCMMIGTVYINLTDDKKLFLQLNYFSPPILLLFFVRSGLGFRLDALAGGSGQVGTTPLWIVGVVYFAVRIVGKYVGAYVGCLVTKKDKSIRNYLGLALIPQAGVAIGLAALGARTLGGETGEALNTIILASSVLYEMIGPVAAKLSLSLSKSYSTKLEDIAPINIEEVHQPTEVELLIARIQAIQKELPKHNEEVSAAEQAFTEAAEEQLESLQYPRRRGMMNRM